MKIKRSMIKSLALTIQVMFLSLLTGAVQALPFIYVSNGADDTISVINGATDEVLGTPIVVEDAPGAIVASPDGSKVYVTSGTTNKISVIDTATNTKVDTIEINPQTTTAGLVISADGSTLYTIGSDFDNVIAIDVTNKILSNAVSLSSFLSLDLALSPDGTKIYALDFAAPVIKSVKLTDNSVSNIMTTHASVSAAFSPNINSKKAYAVDGVDNKIIIIDDTTTDHLSNKTIPVGTAPVYVVFSPDGNQAYVSNAVSNNVTIIDALTDTVLTTVEVGAKPRGIAFTPDGSRAYIANNEDGTVSVIEVGSQTSTGTAIKVGASPFSIAIVDLVRCGDGFKEKTEECDDGNNEDGDGCDNSCVIEVPPPYQPVCGNGIKEGDEECDDGDDVIDNACSNECTLNKVGGDGCSLSITHPMSWASFLPLATMLLVFGFRRFAKKA